MDKPKRKNDNEICCLTCENGNREYYPCYNETYNKAFDEMEEYYKPKIKALEDLIREKIEFDSWEWYDRAKKLIDYKEEV